MAELDRVAICRRIAQARDESGLTQPELAAALGVHPRTAQNWEIGERSKKTGELRWVVPWDRLEEIAILTGVTRDWLLRGDDASDVPGEKILAELRELGTALGDLQGAVEELRDEVRRTRSAQDG